MSVSRRSRPRGAPGRQPRRWGGRQPRDGAGAGAGSGPLRVRPWPVPTLGRVVLGARCPSAASPRQDRGPAGLAGALRAPGSVPAGPRRSSPAHLGGCRAPGRPVWACVGARHSRCAAPLGLCLPLPERSLVFPVKSSYLGSLRTLRRSGPGTELLLGRVK